jgi:hypothetical protein
LLFDDVDLITVWFLYHHFSPPLISKRGDDYEKSSKKDYSENQNFDQEFIEKNE